MTPSNHLFSELIQVSIGKRDCLSRTPTAEEWHSLFNAAMKQAVAGVCFYGVNRINAPEQLAHLPLPLKMKWLTIALQIRQQNQIINSRSIELQNMLATAGFRSVILKGQGVAALYRAPREEVSTMKELSLYRQSGDIDAWVDATREEVIRYAVSIKPTREFDQKHVHFDFFDDVPVELHWVPVYKWNPKWNRLLKNYFEQERDKQFEMKGEVPHFPTVDFQLTHQLLHVMGHFIGSGIGLRQMMDLYFAQMACIKLSPAKVTDVLKLFRKMGLMKFVAATQWVIREVFLGRESTAGLLLCEPDEQEGKMLLADIETGGNFGQHDTRNHVAGKTPVNRFWRKWSRELRLIRFDTLGAIAMPFMRLKLELWMRMERHKLNV